MARVFAHTAQASTTSRGDAIVFWLSFLTLVSELRPPSGLSSLRPGLIPRDASWTPVALEHQCAQRKPSEQPRACAPAAGLRGREQILGILVLSLTGLTA